MFIVRFDMRTPGVDGPGRASRYRAAVEMARYVDAHGCASIVLSEHHASDDGYLPSPFVLAGAIAAATERTPIVIAVTLLPLQDPVRLAEDIVTLDHLSGGRAMVVLGIGYRPVEYELYGVDFSRRGRIADEKLETLIGLLEQARVGMAPARVTPAPMSPISTLLAWGGASEAAARRAGRNGIGLFAQSNGSNLRDAYVAAARESGHEPGLCILPSPEAPYSVFVADDVDTGWHEVGPSLLVDAVAYHQWNQEAGSVSGTASISSASTVDELRSSEGAHRIVTAEGARDLLAEHRLLALHPLCGGLDPDVAWRYLEDAVAVVGTGPASG
ncbi:MAG: LLM class flavin-dependent oxidoreductase [Acidimicrobiales bacterium]|nr:LLM class flavin-dependent oxidoreductase [Acidimicrobiales bacterium]